MLREPRGHGRGALLPLPAGPCRSPQAQTVMQPAAVVGTPDQPHPGAAKQHPRGGRPRKVEMREVPNTLFYLNRSGCQWDMLPQIYCPESRL